MAQTKPNEPETELKDDISIPDEAESDRPTDLSKDDIFHLLQNERRRKVLEYLDGLEGPVRMRDVAEQVAAWEHDTTVQLLESDQRQRVYIALYQSHLPKLDKLGIIDYNQPRGIIEPTERTDEVAGYLKSELSDDSLDNEPDVKTVNRWLPSYIGASMFSAGLTGGWWAGIYPATILSGLGLAAIVTVLFTAVTAVFTILNVSNVEMPTTRSRLG